MLLDCLLAHTNWFGVVKHPEGCSTTYPHHLFKIEACFSSPAHISPIEIFNAKKNHIEKSQFDFPKIQQKESQRSISFIFSQGQALQIYIKISTYIGRIWM